MQVEMNSVTISSWVSCGVQGIRTPADHDRLFVCEDPVHIKQLRSDVEKSKIVKMKQPIAKD
jgi:hypothetical protein